MTELAALLQALAWAAYTRGDGSAGGAYEAAAGLAMTRAAAELEAARA